MVCFNDPQSWMLSGMVSGVAFLLRHLAAIAAADEQQMHDETDSGQHAAPVPEMWFQPVCLTIVDIGGLIQKWGKGFV